MTVSTEVIANMLLNVFYIPERVLSVLNVVLSHLIFKKNPKTLRR